METVPSAMTTRSLAEVPTFTLEILTEDPGDSAYLDEAPLDDEDGIEELTVLGHVALEGPEDDEWTAVDDVRGDPLPNPLSRQARELELRYLHDRKVLVFDP